MTVLLKQPPLKTIGTIDTAVLVSGGYLVLCSKHDEFDEKFFPVYRQLVRDLREFSTKNPAWHQDRLHYWRNNLTSYVRNGYDSGHPAVVKDWVTSQGD